jgi:hypothetical protein
MDDLDEERVTTPLLKASNAVIEPCPRPRLGMRFVMNQLSAKIDFLACATAFL